MSSITATTAATDIRMDYMRLLIAQLQYQNPLEPMDNNEMASQLAQFSELEQLESINSNFGKFLSAAELGYANSLLGKDVSFLEGTGMGSFRKLSETVNEIYNIEGEYFLIVGKRTFNWADVADSLIGQEVTYLRETQSGTTEITTGIINQVYEDANGDSFLIVDGHQVNFKDVADSLVGKNVSFLVENTETGVIETRGGEIENIYEKDGQNYLVVSRALSLEDVISVKN